MTADANKEIDSLRRSFNYQLTILENHLQAKIKDLQERPFFAEDDTGIKSEGVLRIEAMEVVYQEFTSQVHDLTNKTKRKLSYADNLE
ncbi:hypothetical protein KKB83_03490 [Patescibacteria group bacterium]|nr:hypothetical protein [Patescibacteria group bacterium]